MKFLYIINTALLSFSIAVLGGTLREFSPYPELFYCGLIISFGVLLIGLIPYRIRVKNPFALEFFVVLLSILLGALLWF